jgi:transglutaminase-like putative cysteine protease
LKGTPHYSRTPAIVKLAHSIVGNQRDPVKKAGLLQHWVFWNLRQTMGAEADTAAEVLKTRAGDCTEHTLLFIALARASGLPAREVSGLMYADMPQGPIFAWHAWAQIHDGRGWVSIDPTWDQVRVDATHIEFSHGEDDWGWANVLGTLRIKVLDPK